MAYKWFPCTWQRYLTKVELGTFTWDDNWVYPHEFYLLSWFGQFFVVQFFQKWNLGEPWKIWIWLFSTSASESAVKSLGSEWIYSAIQQTAKSGALVYYKPTKLFIAIWIEYSITYVNRDDSIKLCVTIFVSRFSFNMRCFSWNLLISSSSELYRTELNAEWIRPIWTNSRVMHAMLEDSLDWTVWSLECPVMSALQPRLRRWRIVEHKTRSRDSW